jgi:hypothetical protein
MKHILIAGNDRTRDILPEATDSATPDNATTPLLQARHEAEYLSRLLAKLRTESGLQSAGLNPVPRPGLLGRLQVALHRFLWKLLRYQHDHMAFQQSAINAETAAALEYLRAEYRHDLNQLTQRLAALEARLTPDAPPGS